ncbi:MAG: amidohydrolase [Bryobacteraceae bacterium]
MLRLPIAMFLMAATLAAQAPNPTALKQAAQEMADGRRKLTQEITDTIFSLSELGYQELETSAYVTGILQKEGFRITRGVAGMPTAWVAEWGSGRPVVGLMADIDGLPETSQKPGVAYHSPLIQNGPGHGEGHNAGQAVNVTAALIAKSLMEQYKIPGTIRLYPGIAEELLGSRTYMVNAGLFKDLDIMLSSHISNGFATGYGFPSGSGLVSTQYSFEGVSAHGAGSPWRGRSALDAVELMNVGWNYRREHLRPEQRSHYVIVNGGDQPNVVPPFATVWYFFREWDYDRINELHAIGTRIAEAAAMMTDTKMSERVLGAAWPGHFNQPLAEALYANIVKVGMPQWSDDDQKMAKGAQRMMKAEDKGLTTKVGELGKGGISGGGSDDIAEVSWNLPTVVLRYPGNIPGMVGHHWSSGIAMATPIAHKGATAGAKAHAMTILDLMLDPKLVSAAKAYFTEQTAKTKWQSLIPVDTKPPIHLNKEKMERFQPELRKLRYDPSKYSTYLEQLGVKYPEVRE